MNKPIQTIVLGMILTGFSWGVSIASADAVDDYRAARAAVQEAQHAVETLGPNPTAEEMQHARDLAARAQAALDAAKKAIAAGKADGSVGEETGKLLDEYMQGLEHDFDRAKAVLPPVPTVKVVDPQKNPVEVKNGEEKSWNEFVEAFRELQETSRKMEAEFGYDGAKTTMQKAFDKTGASSFYVKAWADGYWLAAEEALGRMAKLVEILRPLAKSRVAVDAGYAVYLNSGISAARKDSERFLQVSRQIMELDAKRAAAIEKSSKEGKLSSENPDVAAAENALKPLFKSLRDRELIPTVMSAAEWNKRGERK